MGTVNKTLLGFFINFNSMCMGICLHVYMTIMCMPCTCGGQKKESDPLELKFPAPLLSFLANVTVNIIFFGGGPTPS